MDTIDDPLDFETTELQTLDENFRCPICKEFYDTAMILSTCSHSFCAMCIRRSLAAEQCCPKCRAPGHDSNLHNNYDLDNVIHAWKLARKKILELQETTGSYTSQTTIQQEESSHVSQMESTCSTRRSTRLKTVSSRTEDPDLVTCPICQQKMHMLVLNQHVDRCLDGDSTIPPLPSKPTTLGKKKINTGKKPIKIVYDMYKDKDLRRMLKVNEIITKKKKGKEICVDDVFFSIGYGFTRSW
ncbi:uncharacterized protein BX664DRAFT_163577 [Halteromyces radiatus]|uniref:uncharacterized protein n=1 Tax=Halteromyces radiatus TaxID=101107 RepID=UPI00221FDB0F|nr:uncharacterized protein BX664DRAFT_163577 [Halteromyces radiatus]KAI8086707.1 hypothetical protein BX664DRAFT_163577 [Halteromyces radiatus]